MIIDEHLIAEAAALLRSAHRAVCFTGAGVSVPSGIPEFRSPDSGLWEHANPFEVASLTGFRQRPKAFYDWVYPLLQLTRSAQPNAAHLALVRLESLGLLQAVITQNIDNLHTRAGSKTVYELHGHMREATCIECGTIAPAEPLMTQFLEDHHIPRCERCGGVLKPNVILFGEDLPADQLRASRREAEQADVMLIIGTSLEVAPASDMPLIALRNRAKLILINLETTFIDSQASVVIHADAAQALPAIVQLLENRA